MSKETSTSLPDVLQMATKNFLGKRQGFKISLVVEDLAEEFLHSRKTSGYYECSCTDTTTSVKLFYIDESVKNSYPYIKTKNTKFLGIYLLETESTKGIQRIPDQAERSRNPYAED